LAALADPALGGIIICPSNPYLSVDPILAVPGLAGAIRSSRAPVIAISPIVSGKAIKGPAAKIMGDLGIAPDALSVARHYEGLIDGFVLDRRDAQLEGQCPMPALAVNTLMNTLSDKVAVAEACVAFCGRLAELQAQDREAAQ
jgi:LPPG:FO 2-phospho-L-lactate transferase